MASFVALLSRKEQAEAVVAFLAKHECVKGNDLEKMKAEDTSELCSTLVSNADYINAVFSKEISDADIVSFLLALSLLVQHEDNALEQYNQLLKTLTLSSKTHAHTRVCSLVNLYNISPPERQSCVFLALLKFVTDAGLPDVLHQKLSDMPTLVRQWKLSVIESRPFYHTAATLLSQRDDGKRALDMLVAYLATFDDGAAAQVDEVVEVVKKAISIRGVWVLSSVLELKCVQALKKTHALLFELLGVFVSGTYKDYIEFHKKHSDTLNKLGFVYEQLVEKIRYLTLATLGAHTVKLSYKDVGSALELDSDDDVEEWLVRASTVGVLRVKLNQKDSTATVNYALARQFVPSDWDRMGERLDAWQKDVDQLLQTIRKTRMHVGQ